MTKHYVYKGVGFNTKKLSYDQLVVLGIVRNMVKVSDKVHYSHAYGKTFVIETSGKILRCDRVRHVRIENGFLYFGYEGYKELTWVPIYEDGKFNALVLEKDVFGFKDGFSYRNDYVYYVVRHNLHFPGRKKSQRVRIKVHTIIKSVECGLAVLNAMGEKAKKVIHHKNVDHHDNSLENLMLVTHDEHMQLHKEIRAKREAEMNAHLNEIFKPIKHHHQSTVLAS